mmetsp:Transcript_43093/g.63921  ORF Transcript_43093/g.63921 Transcript_43093/m.63921 type:complete len:332 (-) Transcript_43093:1903-2898(-)
MSALGAMPFFILRFSIVRFIFTSSMIRTAKESSIVVVSSWLITTSGRPQTGSGIMTMQFVPGLKLGSLSNLILPPVRSTKCFAIARPRPVPGAPPRCTKRSNNFFCSPFGIPGPVSAHSNRTNFPSHVIESFIDPDTVYLIAFVTTFVMTCCILCASPMTQSFALTSQLCKKETPDRTEGRSILWTLISTACKEIGTAFNVILPSSIFRTSSRLFMIDDMNPVHNCIPATKLLADSGRSSGMAFRALSIAPSGFLNSCAKYAVMFRSVSTLASCAAFRCNISASSRECLLSSVTSCATPTTPTTLFSGSRLVVALTSRYRVCPDLLTISSS